VTEEVERQYLLVRFTLSKLSEEIGFLVAGSQHLPSLRLPANVSAQQYFAFAEYKANGGRLQVMNGLLSLL